MHKHFFYLFLLFELTFLLTDTAVGFFPIFGSFLVSFRHVDNALKDLDALAHAGVQLLLHGVQVVVHKLSEAHQETQGLLKIFAF